MLTLQTVLLITPSCRADGVPSARLSFELATALKAQGWQVRILSADEVPLVDFAHVRVKATGDATRFWPGLRLAARFRRALRRLPVHDVIITTDTPFAFLPLAHALITKRSRRHMHWLHALYPQVWELQGIKIPRLWVWALSRRLQTIYQKLGKIVVVGRCMAKLLVEQGVAPAHISVITNWCPTTLGQPVATSEGDKPAADAKNDSRRHHIDHTPKFRILHFGSISRLAPIATYLQAATIIEASHPDIEFMFVGEGLELLAQERARLGLNNIRLLPPQPADKMYDLLQSGDLHMQGLRNAALGIIVPSEVTAAFAVGRPSLFVGPEESDPAKLITSYQAGQVIGGRDGAGLAAAILKYRYDSDLWFSAHRGALAAAAVFRAEESLQAWCKRVQSQLA
ncbi:MAG: glycosyltransferase [Pseudomonadota bacterium]